MAKLKSYDVKLTGWKALKAAVVAGVSMLIASLVEIPTEDKTALILLLIGSGTAVLNWLKNRD